MHHLFTDNGPLQIGIDEIDFDHESLFMMAQRINRLLIVEGKYKEAKAALEKYLVMVETHFETEENFFHLISKKKAKKHVDDHKKILKKMERILSKFSNKNDISKRYLTFNSIFTRHIMDFDMQLRDSKKP